MGVTRQLEAKQERSTHYLPLDVANKKPCGGVEGHASTQGNTVSRLHDVKSEIVAGVALEPQIAVQSARRSAGVESGPHNFYLRAQIRYILDNLDSIKPSRLRGKVQDRLRDLTNELRNSRGTSLWPLAFAGFCFCFLGVLVYVNRPHPLIFGSPHTSIRVLHQYSDTEWQIQRVVDGVPEPPEVRHFDEKPDFEIGYTLTWLEVNDRGKYWSIKHIDPYFRALRDFKGWPIIPTNCKNPGVGKPVVCEGLPKF